MKIFCLNQLIRTSDVWYLFYLSGLVITSIDKDSPINYLNINDIIIEVQKKRIKSFKDLENAVKMALKSSEKTILILIYNNQNQKRYIGVKLD